MAGKGRLRQRLGREGSSLLRVAPPRRGQDGQNGMAFIWNRYAVAAGPRLRSFVLRTSVLQKRGVCSCWEFQGASRNGGAFQSGSEGQDSQQLSELWFRQSVCWRQLTAAAQAASSLTRIRRAAVRFWRQATCICHPLEQFFNRRASRNRLRARGPRSQGHVPQKIWDAPKSARLRAWLKSVAGSPARGSGRREGSQLRLGNTLNSIRKTESLSS